MSQTRILLLLLLLLRSPLYLWGSPSSPSSAFPAISGVHLLLLHSPAISLGFTFFFFSVHRYIFGVHPSPSTAFPSCISGVYHSSSSVFSGISLGFTPLLLILLLRCQLYLWGSPFSFFFCVAQLYLWDSPSSSEFPAISLGFTLLLLRSPLYLWGSPFSFFCVSQLYLWGSPSSPSAFPSFISGVHFLLLRSQLYLWGSLSSSSSSAFIAISLGFTLLLLLRSPAVSLGFTILLLLLLLCS